MKCLVADAVLPSSRNSATQRVASRLRSTIPRTREIVLPFDKVAEKLPDGIADKVPAGLKKQTKAADLIDLLPWNRYNTDFRTTKK